MFPNEQQSPQGCFSEEVSYLDKFFGNLGSGREAYILGDANKEHQWHIYSASSAAIEASSKNVYTLEMCMTKLDRGCASKFYKSDCSTAKEMTESSGISNLLPKSTICDYVFDPCGYSMNSIEGSCLSTIHVTPEDGFSYASFEAMGYTSKTADLGALVNNVLSCFKPRVFSIALHASGQPEDINGSWESSILPVGYICDGSTKESLPSGTVVFHTFRAFGNTDFVRVEPLPLVAAGWRDLRTIITVDEMQNDDDGDLEAAIIADLHRMKNGVWKAAITYDMVI